MGNNRVPNKSGKYKQGRYICQNPDKYLGDLERIFYRSSWEQKLYYYLDVNKRVVRWSAENIAVPYEINENGNWSTHKYYPDAYCEILKSDNTTQRVVLEIKPYSEWSSDKNEGLQPPKEPKNKTAKSLRNYEYALRTFHKNIIKWQAAKNFCERRGMEFFVMTEQFFQADNKIKLF